MKIKHQTCETIGTIMWLVTDFTWMNGWNVTAAVLTVPTFVMLTLAWVFYDERKHSELMALVASSSWFLMNALWIYSDISCKDTYLLCARIVFVIASTFVCISIFKSKKEKNPSDFKRLKI